MLYLATVIALYSRKVVAWSMNDTMKVSLVNDALNMTLRHGTPNQGPIRDSLKENSIAQNMSRRDNYWNNAVAESFFKSLKNELIYKTIFYTKKQSKIESYLNSYLNGLFPI